MSIAPCTAASRHAQLSPEAVSSIFEITVALWRDLMWPHHLCILNWLLSPHASGEPRAAMLDTEHHVQACTGAAVHHGPGAAQKPQIQAGQHLTQRPGHRCRIPCT